MSPSTKTRVLCVVPNWIGDAVLCLPALQLLARSGVTLQLLGRGGIRRVVEPVAEDVEWIDLPPARWQRLLVAHRLRRRAPQAVALFAPSFSAAVLARVVGSPLRCGESSDGRRLLLSHALPRIDRNRHLSLSYQEIAETCLRALSRRVPPGDADLPATAPEGLRLWPRLRVRDAERQSLRRLPTGVQDAVVVAPGARFGPAKRYPAERFAHAAVQLARQWGRQIVLVGTAADAADTAAVAARCPGAVDLAGRTDLGQLLAILATARVVLSNDSGTMHLAAALDRPVVGVFGSTNPGWTAPLGRHVAVLSHPVFCWPCYARTCREDFACMLDQPAEKLVAAAQRLVEDAD